MIPGLVMESQILAVLRRIIRATDLHSRRLVETVGLTGPQLVTLETAAHLGPISTTALARSIYLSPATVTGILDRLERRGLLERFRDTRDRRSWLVTVTDAGRELLESSPSPLQSQFRAKLDKLADWEQSQILSSLQRIASMMETEEEEKESVSLTTDHDAMNAPSIDTLTAEHPGALHQSSAPHRTVSSMEFSALSSAGTVELPGAFTQPTPDVSPDGDAPA